MPIKRPTRVVGPFVVDAIPRAWFAGTILCRMQAVAKKRQAQSENRSRNTSEAPGMTAQELLHEISDYCRHRALADSTFGRRAVTPGKLTALRRNGGRIPTETLDRIRACMEINRSTALARPAVITREPRPAGSTAPLAASPATAPTGEPDPQRNFRFFDNRQKYLLFVNTCSEKWVVASRVGLELANVHPRPPAMRVFDA